MTSTITIGDPLSGALAAYYEALDEGRMAEDAAAFAEDALYATPTAEFAGRHELLERFEARGAHRFDHRLMACAQRGPHCMVEGLVEGLPEGRSGSFVSSLTLDADGLIRRYLSFYCEPAVRRA
jgi:hypothetical protein